MKFLVLKVYALLRPVQMGRLCLQRLDIATPPTQSSRVHTQQLLKLELLHFVVIIIKIVIFLH